MMDLITSHIAGCWTHCRDSEELRGWQSTGQCFVHALCTLCAPNDASSQCRLDFQTLD